MTPTHVTELAHDQDQDMRWAFDVLAGRGNADDSADVARDMLAHLAAGGARPRIRAAAVGGLCVPFSVLH